ncbi:hypothetical protein FHW37_11858 [Neorhizobium alkalisoli]|uniref:LysR substrate binding domain-containing protein n=1 Tax=Neorhizobium alkalisoli TaxID=528178 RepID=A0A561Q0M2_9HYPH|nr:hypothetical protein FHW37_11858 [Neorhizobium alkalisoli]
MSNRPSCRENPKTAFSEAYSDHIRRFSRSEVFPDHVTSRGPIRSVRIADCDCGEESAVWQCFASFYNHPACRTIYVQQSITVANENSHLERAIRCYVTFEAYVTVPTTISATIMDHILALADRGRGVALLPSFAVSRQLAQRDFGEGEHCDRRQRSTRRHRKQARQVQRREPAWR